MFYYGAFRPEIAGEQIAFLTAGWFTALAGMAIFLLVVIAKNARSDDFRWCGFWTLLALLGIHLLGIFDVVTFTIQHWGYLLAALIVYVTFSYPYVRFVEWRRILPKLYQRREAEEALARENYLIQAKELLLKAEEKNFREEYTRTHGEAMEVESNDRHRSAERAWDANFNRAWNQKLQTEQDAFEKRFEELTKTESFINELNASLKEYGYDQPIKVSGHKALLVGWMLWWPFKLVYRILVQWILDVFERIRDFFHWLFKKLAYKFQLDSDREFARRLQLMNNGERELL